MKLFYACMVILLISSCTNNDNKIVGHWKRIAGGNKGMIISVTKVGKEYEGKVIAGPSAYSFFQPGDLKWKNVIEKSKNYYQYQDLFKGIGGSSYRDSYFNLINDTIKTRVFSKEDFTDAEEQIWVKTDTLMKN